MFKQISIGSYNALDMGRGRYRPTYVTLTLGEIYYIQLTRRFFWTQVKFIKVTPKGFNFLNVETNKCMLRSHVYAKGCAGKPIPREWTSFTVGLPPWIGAISDANEEKKKA